MSEKDFLKSMGAKIKAHREAKGMYMRDLAKLCALHYTSISQIENGNYNSLVLTLKRLADALDADVKDFL